MYRRYVYNFEHQMTWVSWTTHRLLFQIQLFIYYDNPGHSILNLNHPKILPNFIL